MTGNPLFEPRIALASLSGESDARWANAAAEHVGCAFLGGVAIDDVTRRAARAMVSRNRDEFIPADPIRFIENQFRTLEHTPIRPAVNVRSATLVPIEDTADLCRKYGAILEINAHCRQTEMCEVGAGQSLLSHPDKLCTQVTAASATGATVSVKVRAEVAGVDLSVLAAKLDDAGADAIHIDAMDSEPIVARISDSVDAFVIANNGVKDATTATEYLDYGADAVSVGRASDDLQVLQQVQQATDNWYRQEASP